MFSVKGQIRVAVWTIYLCSRYDNADMPVRRWKYLQKLLAEENCICMATSLIVIFVSNSKDFISLIDIRLMISVGEVLVVERQMACRYLTVIHICSAYQLTLRSLPFVSRNRRINSSINCCLRSVDWSISRR